MKRNRNRILISALIPLFISCVTTESVQMYEAIELVPTEDQVIIDQVEIPEVSLFVSAPFDSEEIGTAEELPEIDLAELPVEEVPALPEPKEVPVQKPVVPVAAPETERIVASEPVRETVKPVQQQVNTVVEEEIVQKEPIILPAEVREVKAQPRKEIEIVLREEGWLYDPDSSDNSVDLVDRIFDDGKTVFRFIPTEEGTFTLVFVLQNLESGEQRSLNYKILTEFPVEEAVLPVVIDPSEDNQDDMASTAEEENLKQLIEEENVPGLVASMDNLLNETTDQETDVLLDAFDLLEKQGGYDDYLVRLAENSFRLYPYDNLSAEMLYRAAQAVEKPGTGQDIEKAIGLFKLVRDYFPLSLYSDKAEERVRYLERHFMKIY